MLLSELIAAVVVDVEGNEVGAVGDVRLVQDGPFVDPFGAAFRVEGLVAGGHALATRLGYHRGDVVGPRLLALVPMIVTAILSSVAAIYLRRIQRQEM